MGCARYVATWRHPSTRRPRVDSFRRMLNYIWAALIVFAGVFALVSDVSDLRQDVYRNGRPLAASVHFRGPPDLNAKESAVDLIIEPGEYVTHFHTKEKPPTTMPATLTRIEGGYQLRL